MSVCKKSKPSEENNPSVSKKSKTYNENNLSLRNLLDCVEDLALSMLKYKETTLGNEKRERFFKLIQRDEGNKYELMLKYKILRWFESTEITKVKNAISSVANSSDPTMFWKMMCAIVRSGCVDWFNIVVKSRWQILEVKEDPSISSEQLEQMVVNVQEHVAGADGNDRRAALIVAFELYSRKRQFSIYSSRVFFETIMAVQFSLEAGYELCILNNPTFEELDSDEYRKHAEKGKFTTLIVLITGLGNFLNEEELLVNTFEESTFYLLKIFIMKFTTEPLKNCTKIFINNILRFLPEGYWPRPYLEKNFPFVYCPHMDHLLVKLSSVCIVNTCPPVLGHFVKESRIGSQFLISLIHYLANPGDKPFKTFVEELALRDAKKRLKGKPDAEAEGLARKYYKFSKYFPNKTVLPH